MSGKLSQGDSLLTAPSSTFVCCACVSSSLCLASDDDIVFEDFARQRLKGMKDEKEEEEDGTNSPQLNDR